jgi:DNA-binding IclR family transcriptional regulator
MFEQLADCAANGERVSLAELARRCGLYDYRHARRLVKSLKEMGAVS